MRIIFVRHGHPNYEKDCLTELGHLQAEAAAERLKGEPIEKIYSSTNGRAYETAGHINKYFGLEIEQLQFMRELSFVKKAPGMEDSYPEIPDSLGFPWEGSDTVVAEGKSLFDKELTSLPVFAKFNYPRQAEQVCREFDGLLASLGVVREGLYYRIPNGTKYKTLLMVSHGGSSTAVLAHLFNLPFHFLANITRPHHTSVTVVDFPEGDGPISPRLTLFNDAKHIQGVGGANINI